MRTLTERLAELALAEHAFTAAAPGFVGATLEIAVGHSTPRTSRADGQRTRGFSAGQPRAHELVSEELPELAVPARARLRHGFLDGRILSGPPSPGLEVCLTRMSDDLAAARHRLGPGSDAATPVEFDGTSPGPVGASAELTGGTGGAAVEPVGVRVALEAGLDGAGPLDLPRRWVLAHTLAPVLAAAFANSPARGYRSTRQARHRRRPVLPLGRGVGGGAADGIDPRRAWAATALDAGSLRDRIRAGHRPTLAELDRHSRAVRPPVAARGHLEIDVADSAWPVAIAVTAVLLDDPRAATTAEAATAHLTSEDALWERASRDALTDPVLAEAARDCFLAAYAALARQGAARDLRDTVASFTERYVLQGRCPADDRQSHSPVT